MFNIGDRVERKSDRSLWIVLERFPEGLASVTGRSPGAVGKTVSVSGSYLIKCHAVADKSKIIQRRENEFDLVHNIGLKSGDLPPVR